MPSIVPAQVPELAQLHDIHMPAPIEWWSLGLGWYVLTAGILAITLWVIYGLRRRYIRGYARRQALSLLKVYQQQHQHNPDTERTSSAISQLLKRVAMAYYSRDEVASLQGEAWLLFLNQTTATRHQVDFMSLRRALLEYPYQAPTSADLEPLFDAAHRWLLSQPRARTLCLN